MCFRAINKKDGSIVPCGKCPECIGQRIKGWTFRLIQELQVSNTAHFITLTYDNKHAPTDLFGNPTLRKKDLQLFIKRLRKAHKTENTGGYNVCVRGTGIKETLEIRPIKYYGVGEYGSRTRRPHYHIILFNARTELIQDAWGITDTHGSVKEHYGQVHYGDERGVTEASITYCFKYLQKQNRHQWDGDLREKEFANSSKGLGIEYLTESMANWHAADIENRMYLNTRDGKKISMPRYYKDRIFYDGERCAAAKKIIAKLIEDSWKTKDLVKDYRNKKAAIEAAFDKMYHNYSLAQKL